ncbi:hypothetical protein L288_06215 [Sphingobium quisquiliarum P25]|uniref:Uncharacterized protein n=1 Tax=Sphingobium quisquiliarum P25 TaxID=1329909 RepID=T0H894_9SPHN|nr:hypothetical protein L288_06215 [Sphingobium quisquiliarum P25]
MIFNAEYGPASPWMQTLGALAVTLAASRHFL